MHLATGGPRAHQLSDAELDASEASGKRMASATESFNAPPAVGAPRAKRSPSNALALGAKPTAEPPSLTAERKAPSGKEVRPAPEQEAPAIPARSSLKEILAENVAPAPPGPEGVSVAATQPAIGELTQTGQSVKTRFGGLLFLLNAALALGLYGDFTQPKKPGLALLPWDLLALIGRAWFGREFESDPLWRLLAKLAGRSPLHAPETGAFEFQDWSTPPEWLAPWGEIASLRVRADSRRLQIWHDADFIVVEAVRDPRLPPLAQAARLCAEQDALSKATRRRIYRSPRRLVSWGGARGKPKSRRWLQLLLLYLEARLRRALCVAESIALVCRYEAELIVSPTALDAHFSLAALPIELRVAGLDRDPGWIPAAGRTLAFRFS